MSADDGVYYSANRRRQRRKRKVAAGITGLAVLVGGAAYAATAWMMGRDATAPGDTAAVAPWSSTADPSAGPGSAGPRPRPAPATRSGVRRASRPSPTAAADNDAVAAALIGRLVEPPVPASSSLSAQSVDGKALTVRTEIGPEGTAIRVVSARADLTSRWGVLGAADHGRPAGTARCTQNVRLAGERASRVRPGVLLCWRTSAAKSVVTVATKTRGRPSAASSEAVINREWMGLG